MRNEAVQANIADGAKLHSARPLRLLDRERLSYLLGQVGLDAVILGEPANIYHATGVWPATAKLGIEGGTIAVVPQDLLAPTVLVTSDYVFYYLLADLGISAGVDTVLYGDQELNDIFASVGESDIQTTREIRRRERTHVARHIRGEPANALRQAFSSLVAGRGRFGFDGNIARLLASGAFPDAELREAGDLYRHARMVKTADEIELMQEASRINIAAAKGMVANVRQLASTAAIRREFFSLASKAGNTPVFMAVDGSAEESIDEELADGTCMMIDCVTHHQYYHGDYARTIYVGEPPRRKQAAVKAIGRTWEELRGVLRPGLTFSEIRSRARSIIDGIEPGLDVRFNTHLVGLAHTDQPFFGLDGLPHDLALESGMILSVDCPLIEGDTGGTAHLEDLMLITADGAEPIHETGDHILMA